MGIFSNIGSDLEAAAGVALIVTGGPLGILAGSLLVGQFAASSGLLGGGVKNFANSAAGHDLVLAAGLTVGAVAGYEALANNAGQAASASAVNANVAPTTGAGPGIIAPTPTDAVATPNMTLATTAPDQLNLGSMLTNQDASIVSPMATDAAQAAVPPGNGVVASPAEATSAVATGGQSLVGNPATQAVQPTSGGGASGVLSNVGSALGTAASAVGTGLSNVGKWMNANPMGAMMGGQALSGLAQGIMGQKSIQEQIAAQQWPNLAWNNPANTAQVQTAAAQPITVPQGYLNRAAAVRTLMNSTPGGGSALPAPPSTQPTTPAPSQSTVPPVGMSPGGGPVPVVGMGATPRGGVI